LERGHDGWFVTSVLAKVDAGLSALDVAVVVAVTSTTEQHWWVLLGRFLMSDTRS
jgi:hypothetical protein